MSICIKKLESISLDNMCTKCDNKLILFYFKIALSVNSAIKACYVPSSNNSFKMPKIIVISALFSDEIIIKEVYASDICQNETYCSFEIRNDAVYSLLIFKKSQGNRKIK